MSAKLPDPRWLVAGAALVALGVVAWYVVKKGSIGAAAASAGQAVAEAAVQAVQGAAVGGVGAVGAAVGLPTPDQTVDDPAVIRWLIDREGYFTASKWATAGALFRAAWLDAGSGRPPDVGSPLALAVGFSGLTLGDFTRTDHGGY